MVAWWRVEEVAALEAVQASDARWPSLRRSPTSQRSTGRRSSTLEPRGDPVLSGSAFGPPDGSSYYCGKFALFCDSCLESKEGFDEDLHGKMWGLCMCCLSVHVASG